MLDGRIINTDRIPLRQGTNGTWQLRKRINGGKRLEISLGTTQRDVAEERAKRILGAHADTVLLSTWAEKVAEGMQKEGWLRRIHALMRFRCGKKGWVPAPIEVLENAAKRSGGRCEVSGIEFHMGSKTRHPFQPSIDRIDSSKGYESENIRLVCLVVNFCMGQWGESVFYSVAAATVSKRLAEMASTVDFPQISGENRNKGGRPRKTQPIE